MPDRGSDERRRRREQRGQWAVARREVIGGGGPEERGSSRESAGRNGGGLAEVLERSQGVPERTRASEHGVHLSLSLCCVVKSVMTGGI